MWTPIDTQSKKLVNYLGELPTHLYRYRSLSLDKLDRLIDEEIIEEIIFLAGLADLNDPDEGRFTLNFQGSRDEIFEYWLKAIKAHEPHLSEKEREAKANSNTDELIRNNFQAPQRVITQTRYALENVIRVACFTTQFKNYSMWANYAKYIDRKDNSCDLGHGGICIEYTCDDGWRHLGLHPVEYTDIVPDLKVTDRNEVELVKAVYTKAREWRGEDEWRVMSILQTLPPFPTNFTANSKIKLEDSIQSVIFGMNTPNDLINEISSRVRVKKPTIAFKRVIRDPITFTRTVVDLA
jgi:hypothetical protein